MVNSQFTLEELVEKLPELKVLLLEGVDAACCFEPFAALLAVGGLEDLPGFVIIVYAGGARVAAEELLQLAVPLERVHGAVFVVRAHALALRHELLEWLCFTPTARVVNPLLPLLYLVRTHILATLVL